LPPAAAARRATMAVANPDEGEATTAIPGDAWKRGHGMETLKARIGLDREVRRSRASTPCAPGAGQLYISAFTALRAGAAQLPLGLDTQRRTEYRGTVGSNLSETL
jgi:hypothetical protein